jgi:hypothetical protein
VIANGAATFSCPARSWKRALEPGEHLGEQRRDFFTANWSKIGHGGCDYFQYTLLRYRWTADIKFVWQTRLALSEARGVFVCI